MEAHISRRYQIAVPLQIDFHTNPASNCANKSYTVSQNAVKQGRLLCKG